MRGAIPSLSRVYSLRGSLIKHRIHLHGIGFLKHRDSFTFNVTFHETYFINIFILQTISVTRGLEFDFRSVKSRRDPCFEVRNIENDQDQISFRLSCS